MLLMTLAAADSSETSCLAHGLTNRPTAKPYLRMPERAEGELPRLLSETGAFKDTQSLIPSEALIPFDINVAFWSDGATKSRWIAVPNDAGVPRQKIKYTPTGEWTFPKGTVFIKHFELALDETKPEQRRRLETRLLVCTATGGVFGVTYKWRADNSDAELLATNLAENILVKTAGGARTQTWYYPSRADCRTCHTDLAGGVLGVKTRQMNRDFQFPSGVTDNQLRAWNHIALFDPPCDEADLPRLSRLARSDDQTRSVQDRARSYLDANCAQCHRPGGTVAAFDARYDTPLPQQSLIDAPVLIDQGIDRARAIAPHDIWRSIVFMRINTLDAIKMPPLAHEVLDHQSIDTLREWIESMPGPPVLAPPEISPRGGNFAKPVLVTLKQSEPGVTIHFTLDGSVPTGSDAVYQEPLSITGPTVLRTKAFKPGYTKSITAQEVFIVGEQ